MGATHLKEEDGGMVQAVQVSQLLATAPPIIDVHLCPPLLHTAAQTHTDTYTHTCNEPHTALVPVHIHK